MSVGDGGRREPAVRVLLVEDEPDLRTTLRYNLRRAGYDVTEAGHGVEALELVARGQAMDLVISDVMMPQMDGFELARRLRAMPSFSETPVIFLTARGESADRVEGFRAGADDYLTKPFDVEALLARVQVQARRAVVARGLREQVQRPSPEAAGAFDLFAKVAEWERRFPALAVIRRDAIVGQSPRTLHLLREVLLRAPGKDPVLIVGDTGTGKTGVAEALWRLGPRADKPFRVVNCAELAAADAAITLGKLFGYGKNSGLNNVPREGQQGLLEDLDGGTLFLDEIHQLPLTAQAMLLLPVEGRPFNPAVGKGMERRVDVKFIFATNMDLKGEAVAGRFPSDLYQRLSASQIRVPGLAERREDISTLAEHFLDECKEEFDLPDAGFAPSLMRHLVQRDWPGNVRELRGAVREMARRAAFEQDAVLTVAHLPEAPAAAAGEPVTGPEVVAPVPAPAGGAPAATAPDHTHDDGGGTWDEMELEKLSALRRHRFKISAAERELGLSTRSRTLTNQLRALCFKALSTRKWNVEEAARLVVGRPHPTLEFRMVERMQSYMRMVDQHVAAHTTELVFNNIPRVYRRFLEEAVERSRAGHKAPAGPGAPVEEDA
ncbi:MAG: sigma-54-dependent Fis family transcriptional regulator [Deltaproteobacteria bacterium]|nr:sigma-54-dependent Fis family transcriptional regulator [Deltaproteobacteria bacterium]